jgi:hypothetical protein
MNDIELFAENELTLIETEERAFHERVIHDAERGKQKLTEIQLASLKVLFDNKLYRSTHKTFPEYCKATFDFEKAYSYYQLGVVDCNRNGLGLQSARIQDRIICNYRYRRDHIICH